VWLFHNTKEEFNPSEIEDKIIGFVYIITHIPTGKKYIGKKLLTRAKTKQVNGKKRRFRVESDWRDYWGSNQTLAEEVKQQGEQNYTREILHLCKTKSELSYLETWEIFNRDVLLKEEYYNEWVSVRVRKDQLKSLSINRSTDTYKSGNEEPEK
jgi:hypothetical protein